MKSTKAALIGTAFLVGTAVSANAADIYTGDAGSYKDAPEQVYYAPITWTGFYAGVHAGASFDDVIEFSDDEGNSAAFDIDNAFVGGIHVGYNYQLPSNIVLGAEASISLLDDEVEDVEITDYLASIRGRLGYAFDKTLVYATGGVAFLGLADDVEDVVDDPVGFVVGAGLEHKFTENVSLGVEGLYYNFEEELAFDDDIEVERDFWTVQARLNYHFNSGYEAPLK